MSKLTTRICPADVSPFAASAIVKGMSKTDLLRAAAQVICASPMMPRSTRVIPCHELTEVCYAISRDEIAGWKQAALRMQISFHLWLRECVVPLAIRWGQEAGSGAWTANFSKEQVDLYRAAATSQQMELMAWVTAQLGAAAAWHIAHPK